MRDLFEKVIEFCFDHSTARAFLIFSGIFLIFSIGYAKEYTLIAFFTFFYALIAHRIVVLRKEEKLGDYAVKNWFGVLLYFFIDWLFFIGWIIGTILLLNKVYMTNLLTNYQHNFLSGLFVYVLVFVSAIFIFWIVLIFWRKIVDERKSKN